MNEDKQKILEEIELKMKLEIQKFRGLENEVDKFNLVLDQKMISNIELLLKEIKNISFISVTAAPFSLTMLSSQLGINKDLLILSFVIFMSNVLLLNIGVWFINDKSLKSVSSQKAEGIFMGIAVADINNVNLDVSRRSTALLDFLKRQNKLEFKSKTEPYQYLNIINKIKLLGIILLSSAIFSLIASVALPLLIKLFKLIFCL